MAQRLLNNIRPARPSSTPVRRKGIPLSPLAQKANPITTSRLASADSDSPPSLTSRRAS